MVVVMQERATDAQVEHVVAQLIEMGFDVHRSTGALHTVIGAVGPQHGDPRIIDEARRLERTAEAAEASRTIE